MSRVLQPGYRERTNAASNRHCLRRRNIQVRELGTGKSRLETARSHGIVFQVVPTEAFALDRASAPVIIGA